MRKTKVAASKAKAKKPSGKVRRAPVVASEDEHSNSVIFGGHWPDLEDELRERHGIPYATLVDSQWEEIRDLANFQDYVRVGVNLALRAYWRAYNVQTISPDTVEEIKRVRKLLPDVIVGLFKLSDDPDLFKGQLIHFDRSAKEQRKQLKFTAEMLDRADDLLEYAEERLARKRGGTSYGPLYELIYRLDIILYQEHGILLNRSKNRMAAHIPGSAPEFVWAVLKAANLDVKETTADTVLRDYIRDRGKDPSNLPKSW